MSPDLKYLLFSTILCFVQVLIAATGANQQVGLPTLAGNRLAERYGVAVPGYDPETPIKKQESNR